MRLATGLITDVLPRRAEFASRKSDVASCVCGCSFILQSIKFFAKCKHRMNRRTKTVSATLKCAIRQSPMTCAAISRESGVSESSLSNFMANKHKLSLDAVDRLAKLFGLGLTAVMTGRK